MCRRRSRGTRSIVVERQRRFFDTGSAASATAIRALIKQLIGAENVKAPLTDSKIADLLREQGLIVARRTVAKYREALQIPPVNLRKAA